MFLVLYPFKDVGVVALCQFSGKQLNPEARKDQHQCEKQDGNLQKETSRVKRLQI